MNAPLSRRWIEALELSRRKPPEFFKSSDEIADVSHAGAIRVGFTDLQLSAIFCIHGVPTIAFLVQDTFDEEAVERVHRALWNQGLASLLLVISGDSLRAFSLSKRPKISPDDDFLDRAHVFESALSDTADALVLKNLLTAAESGRLWADNDAHFRKSERIDQILLDNLKKAHELLEDSGLSPQAAQALLMQTMFVAYLEDRGVISTGEFLKASGRNADKFDELLFSGKPKYLIDLFKSLKGPFNGDLFVAPCSFNSKKQPEKVAKIHLGILFRFLTGREEMLSGQMRLWGYDFRYIPVELISAVYDQFLGVDVEAKRKEGAYYTPMFVANSVVSQVWGGMTDAQRQLGKALDPACGSGIFLVQLFQRFVEHRRRRKGGRNLSWKELVSVANRLYGSDIKEPALRIAAFSIYLALLEQVTPPAIQKLMAQGKMLPDLFGKTLVHASYFDQPSCRVYDVIIGNPPWTSRKGDTGGAQDWCSDNKFPCPSGEASWAFVWKSNQDIKTDGVVALLLPAMAILHNHQPRSVAARNRMVKESRVEKIINFSDLAFQLFDGAKRPAALVISRPYISANIQKPYYFDYWTPKADLNLRLKRFVTLSNSDKTVLRSDHVIRDCNLLKRRLWTRSPDEKLLQYLSDLPRLSSLVDEHKNNRFRAEPLTGWIIGQGFKPANPEKVDDADYFTIRSEEVIKHPLLESGVFKPIALPNVKAKYVSESLVHFAGFEDGFLGPHILIPQGVRREEGRVRATYTEQNLVFRHSIQAIKFPAKQRDRAKLLTAILNSRLAAWFYFHETANLGTDRAKVHQCELLTLPFPGPEDIADEKKAVKVANKIVSLIDEAIANENRVLSSPEAPTLEDIDELVYDYYGLTESERITVEDTFEYIIPAMQAKEGGFPDMWRHCTQKDRSKYAGALSSALGNWFSKETSISVSLEGLNSDLAVLKLSLHASDDMAPYSENLNLPIQHTLGRIWEHLPSALSGNFQAIPDLRVEVDGDLYLIKPTNMRHWLRSTAFADADAIVSDLQSAMRRGMRGEQ